MYTNHSEAPDGLRILAFPCNQFANQEPGTNEDIKEFIKGYNVEFDMFDKIDAFTCFDVLSTGKIERRPNCHA